MHVSLRLIFQFSGSSKLHLNLESFSNVFFSTRPRSVKSRRRSLFEKYNKGPGGNVRVHVNFMSAYFGTNKLTLVN